MVRIINTSGALGQCATICVGCLTAAATLVIAGQVSAADSCPFTCGDLNGDNGIDLADFGEFASCMGQSPSSSQECFCSDMDGSGAIDLRDFALLAIVFGEASDEVPPSCTGALGSTAEMTAYRPQHGTGYAPFVATAVAEDEGAWMDQKLLGIRSRSS